MVEQLDFSHPQVIPQPPVLRSPANGASINSGRLEWSHPLDPAEPLVYEVEITTNPAQHQQAYWVYNRPQSPSLRVADWDRLAERTSPSPSERGDGLLARSSQSRPRSVRRAMVRLVVLYLDRPIRGRGVVGCAHLRDDRRRNLPGHGDNRPHCHVDAASDRDPDTDRHAYAHRWRARHHDHCLHGD